ncbi:MAG: HAMP domain-containing protein [Calditrichaeota bacterium]|nr:MAG: HAMP domain-containing protein [Calditrichota bacterium]
MADREEKLAFMAEKIAWKFPHNLLTRLLASHIFLVVIPLFLTGHILTQAAKSSIEETIKHRNLEIAKRASKQVEQRLESIRDILRIVVENPDFFEMSKIGKDLLLGDIFLKYPVFRNLIVTSIDGEILSSTGLYGDTEIFLKSKLSPIIEQGSYASEVYLSDENLLIMDLGEVVIDRFELAVGALCAEVDLRELWTLVDSFNENKVLGESGEAFIFKDDGQFLAHTDRTKVLAAASLQDEAIINDVRTGNSSSLLHKTQEGVEMIMAYAPIPSMDWGIVLQQPTSEAFAPATRMQYQVLMLMLGGLAAATLVAFLYTRNFLRPIDRLVTGITKISSGDLYYRIEPLGKDEISQLAVHINNMSARLRTIQNQLKRTERLETLGKLASVLSHEIRNPLNSMVINMQILRREYKKGGPDLEKLDHYHKVVVSEIKRVDELVSNFLMIAKPPKLERTKCDLAKLVDEIIKSQQPSLLPQGIRTQRLFDENQLIVDVDSNKIKQVFLNIILNSAQAMPGGGRLFIECGKAFLHDQERSNVAKLVFRDTGKGITARTLQHIFDFYYSTKPRGTGLGLPIAQQIIEEHGGLIKVDSELGSGTVVTLYIPLAEQ